MLVRIIEYSAKTGKGVYERLDDRTRHKFRHTEFAEGKIIPPGQYATLKDGGLFFANLTRFKRFIQATKNILFKELW